MRRRDLVRRPRKPDPLLNEVVGAVWDAPVHERQIRRPDLFVFGACEHETGAITLNVPLLRVMLYLHEGTHRVCPDWNETTVRRRSTQLLQSLNDDDVGELNAVLVAAISVDR